MVDIDISVILAGFSIAASIVYYASVLRNQNKTQQMQLETRQATLFLNLYNKSMTSPVFHKGFTKLQQTSWDNYDVFKKIYLGGEEVDEEFVEAYHTVGSFYEGVGVLIRENLLDIKYVASLMSSHIRVFWEKNVPIIDQIRRNWNTPRYWSETEYLYNELMRYGEENPELNIITSSRPLDPDKPK